MVELWLGIWLAKEESCRDALERGERQLAWAFRQVRWSAADVKPFLDIVKDCSFEEWCEAVRQRSCDVVVLDKDSLQVIREAYHRVGDEYVTGKNAAWFSIHFAGVHLNYSCHIPDHQMLSLETIGVLQIIVRCEAITKKCRAVEAQLRVISMVHRAGPQCAGHFYFLKDTVVEQGCAPHVTSVLNRYLNDDRRRLRSAVPRQPQRPSRGWGSTPQLPPSLFRLGGGSGWGSG